MSEIHNDALNFDKAILKSYLDKCLGPNLHAFTILLLIISEHGDVDSSSVIEPWTDRHI